MVVVAIFAAVHWLGVEEHRDMARAWLEKARGTRWGRVLLAIWRPVSGPARFLWHRVTPGGIGLEATTLAAVAAVGAFAFVGLESSLDDRGPTGLAAGDVITKVDDQRITDADSLVATIRSYRPGDNVTVTWTSNGEEKSGSFVLDSDASTS